MTEGSRLSQNGSHFRERPLADGHNISAMLMALTGGRPLTKMGGGNSASEKENRFAPIKMTMRRMVKN